MMLPPASRKGSANSGRRWMRLPGRDCPFPADGQIVFPKAGIAGILASADNLPVVHNCALSDKSSLTSQLKLE